jgi:dipeptidyl aminopeptidase/acylaminoacyl peptidase
MPHPPATWSRIPAYTNPVFSRDGTRLFHLRGEGLPQLWVMHLDGGDAHALTAFNEKVAFLRRAPNDDRVIVGIDAGGDERQQFHLISPDGMIRALTSAPDVIHTFGAWSPDGERIAYSANDRDERVFDILVMELASGAVTQVMEGAGQFTVTGWNCDRISVIEDHSSSDQRLWIIDLLSGERRQISQPGLTRYAQIRWTKDGALMGLTDHGGSDFMRLCRIDPANGGVTLVHAAPGCDVDSWSQAPDRGRLAVIVNQDGYGVPSVADKAIEALPNGVASDLAWSPDGQTLAFTMQSPTQPPGIWLWSGGTATPLVLPDLAALGIDPATLPDWRLVSWTAEDGTAIPGFLVEPKTTLPAAGHPAVIWVHGGPASQTRPTFRADTQMLVDRGYAVLLPNVRGSTGYGRAAMESDDVALRPAAVSDLAAGRHWLAAQPSIDAARIGVMGQSYGGWMVLAAITLYPELWQAAVNYYGIADFVTLLDRTGPWRRDHRAREYGFPETEPALFAAISPIHHIANVTAPLLVAHGNRDPRVPKHESDQFVTAMAERQKKVRYLEFDYAGHGFIRPQHRIDIYEAVAAHFAEHLA